MTGRRHTRRTRRTKFARVDEERAATTINSISMFENK